jgi:predicted nucleic acid-binding protein
MYCIDTSVLVISFMVHEDHHEASKQLMEKVKKKGITVILPEIVLPEVSSAIARGTGDSHLALEFVEDLRNISNLAFIPIDREISDLSAKFAAYYKIRGYDSVCVTISYIFGAKLITLDTEQIERSKNSIDSSTPEDELR